MTANAISERRGDRVISRLDITAGALENTWSKFDFGHQFEQCCLAKILT